MLDKAFVLSDGRRVFKDENGNVFTENGEKVGKDIVDPNAIGEDYSSWKAHQRALRKVEGLDNRLDLKHQKMDKLDADQEALSSGNLTPDKLDVIEGRLEVSKLDAPLKDELDLNPDFLPPNPSTQFKMAAATLPPPTGINLDIKALELNG